MINRQTIWLFTKTAGPRSVAIKGQQHLAKLLRHSTPRKLANWLLAKVQRRFRRAKVWGYPYHYVVDPINICVLRCPLCPTGRGTLKRPRGKMAFDDFRDLIDEVAEYAYFVDLYNWGEPLLHSQIFDMVDYANARNISTKISTNLNYFDAEMAKQAVVSGLEELVISLDGADQETYETYRVGGSLEKVTEGIRSLVRQRELHRSPFPFLTIRVLLNRHNENQIPAIRRLGRQLGVDNVVVAPIMVNTDSREDMERWLPVNDRHSFYNYRTRQDRTLQKVKACPYLWESCVISWEGGVSPCCWYDDPANDFGNAFTEPLKDIWNNEFYVASRRVFRGEEVGRETVCVRCRGRPHYYY
jgi:MoaA/NifB/PqqE/SkfB family radical SAM enzyme